MIRRHPRGSNQYGYSFIGKPFSDPQCSCLLRFLNLIDLIASLKISHIRASRCWCLREKSPAIRCLRVWQPNKKKNQNYLKNLAHRTNLRTQSAYICRRLLRKQVQVFRNSFGNFLTNWFYPMTLRIYTWDSCLKILLFQEKVFWFDKIKSIIL